MACRLLGDNQLSEPMLDYCHLDTGKQISRKFNRNCNILVHENALENVVCQMEAICLNLLKIVLFSFQQI